MTSEGRWVGDQWRKLQPVAHSPQEVLSGVARVCNITWCIYLWYLIPFYCVSNMHYVYYTLWKSTINKPHLHEKKSSQKIFEPLWIIMRYSRFKQLLASKHYTSGLYTALTETWHHFPRFFSISNIPRPAAAEICKTVWRLVCWGRDAERWLEGSLMKGHKPGTEYCTRFGCLLE